MMPPVDFLFPESESSGGPDSMGGVASNFRGKGDFFAGDSEYFAGKDDFLEGSGDDGMRGGHAWEADVHGCVYMYACMYACVHG